MATTTSTQPAADIGLVSGTVSSILGFEAQAAQADAAAEAQRLTAQGYGLEVEAYGQSERLATQNAELVALAGDIQRLQAQREVYRTVGSQRAATAAAGFANSGTALAQVTTSLREGYLTDQLLRAQSALNEAGYLEQAAAARMQSGAAGLAQQSALTTAQAQTDAAALARVYQANQTAALSGYLKEFATTGETNLVTGILAGTDIEDELNLVTAGPNSLTMGAPADSGLSRPQRSIGDLVGGMPPMTGVQVHVKGGV